MPNPDWILAHEATVSIDGAARPVDDAETTEDLGEVDFTNLLSGTDANTGCLSYELKCDVVKRGLRGSMVVDRNAVAQFTSGKLLAGALSVNGERATSGTLVITKQSRKVAPKGGFKVSFEGVFTGTVAVA
jgi:hypothetical protein